MITKDEKKKSVANARGVAGGRIVQGVAGAKTQNSSSSASKVGGLVAKRINIGPRSSMDQALQTQYYQPKKPSAADIATQEQYTRAPKVGPYIDENGLPRNDNPDPFGTLGKDVASVAKGIGGFLSAKPPASAMNMPADPYADMPGHANPNAPTIASLSVPKSNNAQGSVNTPSSVAGASPTWQGFTPSQPNLSNASTATMASQNMIANEITKAQQRQGVAGAQTGGNGGNGGNTGMISSTMPPSTTPGATGTPNEGTPPKSPTAIVQQYSTLQQNGVAPDPTILNPLLQYVGLDQPVSYAEGGQVRQEPLQIGQIVRDMNGGALRGIRADVVVALGTQYTGSPEAVAEALSKIGTNALTVDEVRIMNLMKKPTNNLNAFGESGGNDMGFEWANDTMAVASDGSIGRVDSMGYPIFSGFYRGNDGAYHPLGSVASYSRNNYDSGGGGGGGPSGPTPPVVIGNTTPNGQAGDLGNLVQPVF